MELKEFISGALLSVVNGVKDANSEINCFELTDIFHAGRNLNGTKVDFDLSVVAEQSHEKGSDKGGSVKIQILSAGMNLQSKENEKSQSVQNIKFSVFINGGKIKE
ncbi:MAG: hypothetical protein ACHQHN_09825 [Sphingobacteriales bacterium]